MLDGLVEGFNEWRSAIEKVKAPEERAKLFLNPVAGLKATDAHTLVLKLKRPYPQIIPIRDNMTCVVDGVKFSLPSKKLSSDDSVK